MGWNKCDRVLILRLPTLLCQVWQGHKIINGICPLIEQVSIILDLYYVRNISRSSWKHFTAADVITVTWLLMLSFLHLSPDSHNYAFITCLHFFFPPFFLRFLSTIPRTFLSTVMIPGSALGTLPSKFQTLIIISPLGHLEWRCKSNTPYAQACRDVTDRSVQYT